MEPTKLNLLIVFAALVSVSVATPCLGPTVTPRIYTSSDAALATSSVLIVEFTLACKNDVIGINLYAAVNGKTIPAVKTKGGAYQVSLVEEHANLPKGVYELSIYDEDGFASLRKAQRSGEGSEGEAAKEAAAAAAAAVEPLATVSVNHGGVWKGAPVQSELVALGLAAFVFYLAHSAKSNLQDAA